MPKKSERHDFYWYLPDKKKPFIGSRLAVSELLRVYAVDGLTIRQCHEQAKTDSSFAGDKYDELANILDRYIAIGCADSPANAIFDFCKRR